MSRYLGPLWRKSRTYKLSLSEGKELRKGKKRATFPGIHGKKGRRKDTPFSIQNQAKQKVRFLYGLREKQLYKAFANVRKEKTKEQPGQQLLINLESRIDNIVYRSGIAPTRRCARQLVSHGHFLVNSVKTKTPSFQLKEKQIISFRKPDVLLKNEIINKSIQQMNVVPPYITFNKNDMTITFLRKPTKQDKEIQNLEKNIKTSLVAEWYNRKL